MALTTTYSLTPLLTRVLPGADPAGNSDTLGLANGGFATVADFPDGRSTLSIYDVAGNIDRSISPDAIDTKIAQLDNGDIVGVATRNAGGLTVFTSGFVLRDITTDVRETNADVAALAGGGFVVADQIRYSANTPGDIYVRIFNSSGDLIDFVSPAAAQANDQNASVAGLADGGFVVAWERIAANGNSAAWVVVYNANGTIRSAARQFDGSGTINHEVNVTALASGGFAVGYEDNGIGGISLAIFDATGAFTQYAVPSILANPDSEASVTSLSNGLVLTTFTNYLPGGGGQDDYDIRCTLVDPANGQLLTSQSDPLQIGNLGDSISASSVSALGLAGFVVSYESAITGDVTQQTFQLVRTVTGDAADDSFSGDDAVDIVNGLGGNDTLSGGANADTLNGGDGNDYLNGGAGDDVLSGGANNDFIVGGDDADTLNGGTGADSLLGGTGNDIYVVDNAGDEVSETSALATEIDTVESSVTYTLGANVENLTLTGPGAINGTGNALANTITGNAALNTLSGLGGNDTYVVNGGNAVIIEGTGDGTADVILASVGYVMGAATQVETLRTTADNGLSSINLTGNGFAQTIVGNNGVNVITGGGSADILRGLGGSDIYVVDSLDDIVDELFAGSSGIDTAKSSIISVDLSNTMMFKGDVERATLEGTLALNATGNGLDNLIIGNSGANTLDGKGGGDVLRGLGGNDIYIVDNPADIVNESAAGSNGLDTVKSSTASIDISIAAQYSGAIERITLEGSAGFNASGNALDNLIIGNSGGNRIHGREGADVVRGNGGNDTFVFRTATDSSVGATRDTIADFEDVGDNDTLDLSGFAGVLAYIGQATFTVANQVRATQFGNHVLVEINTIGGAGAESEILLTNTAIGQIDTADFIV